jgi:hypothetical protein
MFVRLAGLCRVWLAVVPLVALYAGSSGCAVDDSGALSRTETSASEAELSSSGAATSCICAIVAAKVAKQEAVATQCVIDCASCGDGLCQIGETATTCPIDCGPICGNGLCESGESASDCPSDCGPPPVPCGTGPCANGYLVSQAQAQARMAWAQWCRVHPGPDASGAPLPGSHYLADQSITTYNNAGLQQPFMYPTYFNFVGFVPWEIPDNSGTNCAVMPTSAINSTMCVAGCYRTPVCGNGVCETGESTSTCATDCPPVCGNGLCEPGETSSTCSFDCGPPPPVCGNGICEGRETLTCPNDCGVACLIAPCQILQ